MHPRHLKRGWVFFLLLFLTHTVYLCHLSGVGPCASPSTIFFFSLFVWVFPLLILGMFPSMLQGGPLRLFILLMRFLLLSLVSSFTVHPRFSFLIFFFFYVCLFDGICIQYFQMLVIFLFSEWSDSFLNWSFYSIVIFLYPLYNYEHWHIFLCRISF